MSTAAGGLKELHQLHIQLQDVQDELARGPRRVQASHRQVEKKQAEIDTMKEQLTQLRMAADQKSLQLKTNEGKIEELKGKLNTATSNREFDIIKTQIEADTMANSVLEDEILEAYEKVDEMKSAIAEQEKLREQAEAKEAEVRGEVAELEPTLAAKKAEIEAALKQAEATLPGTIEQIYRRLVSAHGATALAPIKNKACSACFETFRPNMLVEVNLGKFVFCKSCGRMIYNDRDD